VGHGSAANREIIIEAFGEGADDAAYLFVEVSRDLLQFSSASFFRFSFYDVA
jgi:hypothetical protein